MADAFSKPLEMEHLPIELRQDLSGSHYTTEQSTLITPVDGSMHHLNYNFPSHPKPSHQQQVDSPVGGHYSPDDNKHTPLLSNSHFYLTNSPSSQTSPFLQHAVTEGKH
jgi:hypothetical protein